jgi:hypothetical protein
MLNRRVFTFVLVFVVVAALASLSFARARIVSAVEIRDSGGNVISGGTVLVNTVAYVLGRYVDLSGAAPASASLDVYFNGGSGFVFEATVWTGTLSDGEVKQCPGFVMSKLGVYEFRWTCQVGQPGTLGSLRCDEKTQARTTVQLVVSEPGALAGLVMALSVLGVLAVRRVRSR